MAKTQRPAFSMRGAFQVLRPFRFSGKSFEPGDAFPWRRLSCSPRRLRQLYESRKISFVDDMPEELQEELPEEEILDTDEAEDNENQDAESADDDEEETPEEEKKPKKRVVRRKKK